MLYKHNAVLLFSKIMKAIHNEINGKNCALEFSKGIQNICEISKGELSSIHSHSRVELHIIRSSTSGMIYILIVFRNVLDCFHLHQNQEHNTKKVHVAQFAPLELLTISKLYNFRTLRQQNYTFLARVRCFVPYSTTFSSTCRPLISPPHRIHELLSHVWANA